MLTSLAAMQNNRAALISNEGN